MTYKTPPTFLGSGDPARQRKDYYPPWLDNLADDVTLEAGVFNGTVHGAEDVRAILSYARTLYEFQDFIHIGPYGENGFVEDYAATVDGRPIANIAVVYKNDEGKTQHLVMNHRPLPMLQYFSRKLGEHFAGTEYAKYCADPSSGDAPRDADVD
ncbi:MULTISPECIES: hypothetical protein [unclassified Streptomyces]|uniref:hypothetical protein n=1 Tax=unclassified Streptomyces TaxID=2593676 RepID=UPI003323BFF4